MKKIVKLQGLLDTLGSGEISEYRIKARRNLCEIDLCAHGVREMFDVRGMRPEFVLQTDKPQFHDHYTMRKVDCVWYAETSDYGDGSDDPRDGITSWPHDADALLCRMFPGVSTLYISLQE